MFHLRSISNLSNSQKPHAGHLIIKLILWPDASVRNSNVYSIRITLDPGADLSEIEAAYMARKWKY